MYFILGVSVTLNIVFIILSFIAYKRFMNPVKMLDKFKPKIEDEFKEWRL